MRSYLTHMAIRDIVDMVEDDNFEEQINRLEIDIRIIQAIKNTRYLRGQTHKIAKAGNIHLAWIYADNPDDQDRFLNMLRVSPLVFNVLVELIKDDPVFCNNANVPQAAVEYQLSVTLYRMGRYGNGASMMDVARVAGCSEGSVEKFTDRCLEAIDKLHDMFVRKLTEEEKEVEKRWMEERLGFSGLWREGWLMYDGTIAVLYARPGLNGDAYYTRKANYGFNVQVCC